MPQLSLYFDEPTLKLLEKAAKTNNLSVSKWVKNKVLRSLEEEWPDNYFALFGTIHDQSLKRSPQPESFSAGTQEVL
ncbi:MAG: toxin-antitoxin system, antitoxin component [Deltaproteobacteria bacterium]|nr:toxin-antitoxin system, antitoxin component [Candidatus Tharpellaceae bacterium]